MPQKRIISFSRVFIVKNEVNKNNIKNIKD